MPAKLLKAGDPGALMIQPGSATKTPMVAKQVHPTNINNFVLMPDGRSNFVGMQIDFKETGAGGGSLTLAEKQADYDRQGKEQYEAMLGTIKKNSALGVKTAVTYSANGRQAKAFNDAAKAGRMPHPNIIGPNDSNEAQVQRSFLLMVQQGLDNGQLTQKEADSIVIASIPTVGYLSGSTPGEQIADGMRLIHTVAAAGGTVFLRQNQHRNFSTAKTAAEQIALGGGKGSGVNQHWMDSKAGHVVANGIAQWATGFMDSTDGVMYALDLQLADTNTPAGAGVAPRRAAATPAAPGTPTTTTVPPNSGPPISPETVQMYKALTAVLSAAARDSVAVGGASSSPLVGMSEEDEEKIIRIMFDHGAEKYGFLNWDALQEAIESGAITKDSVEGRRINAYIEHKVEVLRLRAEPHPFPDGRNISVAECIANGTSAISLETRIRENADGTVSHHELKTFGNVPNQQQLLQGVAQDLADLIHAGTMVSDMPPKLTFEQFKQHVEKFTAKYPDTAKHLNDFLCQPGVTVESVPPTVPGHKPTINFRMADGDSSKLAAVLTSGVHSAAANAHINAVTFNNTDRPIRAKTLKATATAGATAAARAESTPAEEPGSARKPRGYGR